MPNTHETLTELFTDIADSIRAKTGSTDPIVADDFPSAIDGIEDAMKARIANDHDYSYTFPAGLTNIPSYLFWMATRLTSVTIPTGYTTIGESVFRGTTKLASFHMPDSITTIGGYLVSEYGSNPPVYALAHPRMSTKVGDSTYRSNPNYKYLRLHNGITTINGYGLNNNSFKAVDLTDYTSDQAVPQLSVNPNWTGTVRLFFRDQATLDNFAAAANWSPNASKMFVADMATQELHVGETFTPSTSATVATWVAYKTNYADGTLDTATGAFTASGDPKTGYSNYVGLIGLDASGYAVYFTPLHIIA